MASIDRFFLPWALACDAHKRTNRPAVAMMKQDLNVGVREIVKA
jgi:hypothetical protein